MTRPKLNRRVPIHVAVKHLGVSGVAKQLGVDVGRVVRWVWREEVPEDHRDSVRALVRVLNHVARRRGPTRAVTLHRDPPLKARDFIRRCR
jgi:hypothetical protein